MHHKKGFFIESLSRLVNLCTQDDESLKLLRFDTEDHCLFQVFHISLLFKSM